MNFLQVPLQSSCLLSIASGTFQNEVILKPFQWLHIYSISFRVKLLIPLDHISSSCAQ